MNKISICSVTSFHAYSPAIITTSCICKQEYRGNAGCQIEPRGSRRYRRWGDPIKWRPQFDIAFFVKSSSEVSEASESQRLVSETFDDQFNWRASEFLATLISVHAMCDVVFGSFIALTACLNTTIYYITSRQWV